MASIGHIAVGVVAGRLFSKTSDAQKLERDSRWKGLWVWMLGFTGLSMLPDADVLGFSWGISYYAPWGHRGASHSLMMAVMLGLVLGGLARWQGASWWRVGLWVAVVVASHGLLDTLTNGGLGAALLWPFSNERFFAPWRPLPVAPLGWSLLSRYGLYVMRTELLLFLPFFLYAFWPGRKKIL